MGRPEVDEEAPHWLTRLIRPDFPCYFLLEPFFLVPGTVFAPVSRQKTICSQIIDQKPSACNRAPNVKGYSDRTHEQQFGHPLSLNNFTTSRSCTDDHKHAAMQSGFIEQNLVEIGSPRITALSDQTLIVAG